MSNAKSGRRPEAYRPNGGEVRSFRIKRGKSAAWCAALIHTTPRVWYQYEAGDREMHAAFWELANLKAPPL